MFQGTLTVLCLLFLLCDEETHIQGHTTYPPILAKKEQEEEKKAMMGPFCHLDLD